MKKFQIHTGGESWEQVAKTMESAIVIAFRRKPPKHPALLTRARTKGGPYRVGPWLYISTETMIKRAGYSVTDWHVA